jgi:hypothetical protein
MSERVDHPCTVCGDLFKSYDSMSTHRKETHKVCIFFLICVQVAHHLQHIIVLIHNDMLMNYRPVLFELRPYNLKFVCIV